MDAFNPSDPVTKPLSNAPRRTPTWPKMALVQFDSVKMELIGDYFGDAF
jgi:hypothetical protein